MLEEEPVSLHEAPTRSLNMIEAINEALDITIATANLETDLLDATTRAAQGAAQAAIDAARMDGASYFTILWKVILPLSQPVIAGYAVITFMDAWNDYLWPLVMLTKPEMMTVPVALGMVNGQFERNFGVQMAGSLISIVPVVLIYLFAQSKMKDGLTLGGIKG